MFLEGDLLGHSGEPRGESMDYSTELLEKSSLSLSPLEAARVAEGGNPGPSKGRVTSSQPRPAPLVVTGFLGPIATLTPRSDVPPRSDFQ